MAKKKSAPTSSFKTQSNSSFYIKLIALLLFLSSILIYLDSTGLFNPEMLNNHSIKKWNSFYEFTKDKDVDILLLGSSHMYTGINPKNLSLALGATSFVLASPGTNIADSYWGLKEAIKRSKPKIVVLETFGINDFNPFILEGANLSDQFKSFSARKDVLTKLISTPFLFKPNNYLLAWSNTLRNHQYLLNNYKQIEENIEIIETDERYKENKEKKLYLGRFVRFSSGIKEAVLKRYETEGAPVDGSLYTFGEYAEDYVQKFKTLCEENNIELIFLTLPMYERHIKDYQKWHSTLSLLLEKTPANWIDMQEQKLYDKIGFTTEAFEDTYIPNQHMTYIGSLQASYSLASYIRDSLKIKLPNRAENHDWVQLFYGDEGFFENITPDSDGPIHKVLSRNQVFKGVQSRDIMLINTDKTNNLLIAKINKNQFTTDAYKNKKLKLLIKYNQNGIEQLSYINLEYNSIHQPKDVALFSVYTIPIEVTEILDGVLE